MHTYILSIPFQLHISNAHTLYIHNIVSIELLDIFHRLVLRVYNLEKSIYSCHTHYVRIKRKCFNETNSVSCGKSVLSSCPVLQFSEKKNA